MKSGGGDKKSKVRMEVNERTVPASSLGQKGSCVVSGTEAFAFLSVPACKLVGVA